MITIQILSLLFSLLLLQDAGRDVELSAVCGPAVDRYGQRSHSQAEANTGSNNGCLHLHGTGIRAWIKDNERNALKTCSLTSRSGLLLCPCHRDDKQLFPEDLFSFPHLHHPLIVSHYRNPARRGSRFSACRGRCTSTPHWILIRMKLWSKCGWRSSLSHCCTPSPSTSCPASAPRTSAAPPTRRCTSKPVKIPLGAFCLRSPPCLLLQGEGAEPPFFWDESSQTEVDLHVLHVPFSLRRRDRW